MVEFQSDDDPETSGNGKFLLSENQNIDIDFIHYQDVSKCNTFLVDKPPHNSDYFLLQMVAVKNYYNTISNNSINFNIGILDTVFQLNNSMRYYATSETQIGLLFSESIDKVNLALETEELFIKDLNSLSTFNPNQDILYVVFHAGLGQESSTDFDPTIYDIRSAYIDENMLDNTWIVNNNINEGLVLPETLNMIYYDTIEDAIPSSLEGEQLENIYCNQQFGMSGLFAYLLGYSFGYPPLHNFENGQTRVGVFDLMDVGFFNGHGVIPVPPSAWIRSNEHFNFNTTLENITTTINNLEDTTYALPCRLCDSITDKIYKIEISNDEYFLIENRINSLGNNEETIDDLYDIYSIAFHDEDFSNLPDWFNQNNNFSPAWFDILVNEFSNYIEIDGDGSIPTINNAYNYNVITKINNYDAGLPGSGLLIWHIKEPEYNNGYSYGINNDILNKAISLEEGDGSNDIGELNLLYGLWSNEKFISGTDKDFWYWGNSIYKSNNQINGYNSDETIYFNDLSFPNTKTINGVSTNISLRIKPKLEDNKIEIEKGVYDSSLPEIYFINETFSIIGNNGNDCIYYLNSQDFIFEQCFSQIPSQLYFSYTGNDNMITGDTNSNNNPYFSNFLIDGSAISSPEILFYDNTIYLVEDDSGYYFDEYNQEITNNATQPLGFFDSTTNIDFDNPVEVENALSLGNIDDFDIYNEKIYLDNGNLKVENYNGSSVNGFPVYGDYFGVPLILNLYDEFIGPEIVCENDDKIDILSSNGQLIYQIPSFSNNGISTLQWNGDDIALVNGNRLYIFEDIYNDTLSYWMNKNSRPSNYPKVTGIYSGYVPPSYSEEGIALDKVYNYPNPVNNNSTTFRFFVYDASSVSIDIYDITGFRVEKLYKNTLELYEYNEIIWSSINLPPGLYFASVKSNLNQSKVIKVVIE